MSDTASIDSQARLLADLMTAPNFERLHDKALALLAGEVVNNGGLRATAVERLIRSARDVVQSADATGCSDDLTVTSARAVEALERALALVDGAQETPSEYRVYGFGISDVHSLRPDLTDTEAMAVLQTCEHCFDASIGLNWQVIESHADSLFPFRRAIAACLDMPGTRCEVLVLLHSGRLLRGTAQELLTSEATVKTAPYIDTAVPSPSWLLMEGQAPIKVSEEFSLFGGDSFELHDLMVELEAANVPMVKVPLTRL